MGRLNQYQGDSRFGGCDEQFVPETPVCSENSYIREGAQEVLALKKGISSRPRRAERQRTQESVTRSTTNTSPMSDRLREVRA